MKIKLLVGLGNPGTEYDGTRHNVGWGFLDYVVKKQGGDELKEEKKFNALAGKIKEGKTTYLVIKLLTFVNASGPMVAKLLRFYKIKPKDLVVVQVPS